MIDAREQRDRRVAFAIFRLTMGINIGLHGATRIVAGAGGFAATPSRSFEGSVRPESLIWGFLVVLPFVEAAIGLAQVLGWRTRLALTSGALLMAVLVFGTALRSDWSSLGLQMIYVLGYYFLISHAGNDAFGLDSWLARRSSPAAA